MSDIFRILLRDRRVDVPEGFAIPDLSTLDLKALRDLIDAELVQRNFSGRLEKLRKWFAPSPSGPSELDEIIRDLRELGL